MAARPFVRLSAIVVNLGGESVASETWRSGARKECANSARTTTTDVDVDEMRMRQQPGNLVRSVSVRFIARLCGSRNETDGRPTCRRPITDRYNSIPSWWRKKRPTRLRYFRMIAYISEHFTTACVYIIASCAHTSCVCANVQRQV